MLDIEWEDVAQDDLLAIVVYIAEDNPNAAIALKEEIEKKGTVCGSSRECTDRAAWKERGRLW